MRVSFLIERDDIKKTLRLMISESGLPSLAALGRELNLKETTFRSALNNNSIRLKEFLKAADVMDYEVIVRKKQQ